MPPPFTPPAGYDRIMIVGSFDELVTSSFGPRVNALCWPRSLAGDFDALAACFAHEDDIVSLDEARIDALRPQLSPTAHLAADAMIDDLTRLRARGLQPSLECVPRYQRDEDAAIVPTDVYSFHADRAPVMTDTYLCSYNQSASEGLRNDMAQRHIDIPVTRAALLNAFQQEGADDFDTYLRENCYDLHYAPMTGAVPFSFGIGNLWRIAVEYPGAPVAPCIHRAPETISGRPPRLLLIS